MDFQKLAISFSEIENEKTYFLEFSQEILDFTDKDFNLSLNIHTSKNLLSVSIATNQELVLFLELAKLTIFSQGNKILTWNWKNFVSFILGRLHQTLKIDSGLIDIKNIETYLGIKRNAPKTLTEALNRLRERIIDGSWKKMETIYKNIQIPLMTEVIPYLETIGILSDRKLHAYYEINGQENGRLRCFSAYQQSFVPHNLSLEKKKELKPINYDQLFMYFDFKSMEVKTLGYLSQDKKLEELCEKEDIYSAIYEEITKKKSENKSGREDCKKFFLQVFYGQSAFALSESLKIPLNVAEELIARIKEIFSTAWNYIENYQNLLKQNPTVYDYFGKPRTFIEKEYRVRNFAVQSPAALICLEKLIELYFAVKPVTDMAYHVHDGYMLYVTKENWKEIFEIGHSVLTSESKLCPGLKFRVSCHAGRNLSSLNPIRRKNSEN